ncbi:nucleotidyl transferase AbiEii/AbiGii toxin family protein [Luteimonas dalianensis]
MFERPHHQRIALLLGALDADLFRRLQCLFGGGTAMALRYGEYRESVDVVASPAGVAGSPHGPVRHPDAGKGDGYTDQVRDCARRPH